MKRVFFYAYASGRYKNYIDLWNVFMQASYPESGRMAITVEDEELAGKQQYYAACIGYVKLLPKEILEQYDYFYITDIDVMIARETPSLVDVRSQDMIDGIYSNTARDGSLVGECGRLTAPHFCTRNWFDKTEEARRHFYKEVTLGTIGNKLWDNEVILYKMAKLSGISIAPIGDAFQYHHGIHLGNQRNILDFPENAKRSYMLAHISPEWAKAWYKVQVTAPYLKAKEKIRLSDQQAYLEVVTVEKYVQMILAGVK